MLTSRRLFQQHNSLFTSFKNIRHSRAGGNPVLIRRVGFDNWIPACAGMTALYFHLTGHPLSQLAK
jgi:hypothetical protein